MRRASFCRRWSTPCCRCSRRSPFATFGSRIFSRSGALACHTEAQQTREPRCDSAHSDLLPACRPCAERVPSLRVCALRALSSCCPMFMLPRNPFDEWPKWWTMTDAPLSGSTRVAGSMEPLYWSPASPVFEMTHEEANKLPQKVSAQGERRCAYTDAHTHGVLTPQASPWLPFGGPATLTSVAHRSLAIVLTLVARPCMRSRVTGRLVWCDAACTQGGARVHQARSARPAICVAVQF